jgi:hypothetical protein
MTGGSNMTGAAANTTGGTSTANPGGASSSQQGNLKKEVPSQIPIS